MGLRRRTSDFSMLKLPSGAYTSTALHDAIYLRNPFTNLRSPSTVRYLVFVICGNPGLIEYYRSFMTCLYAGLGRTQPATHGPRDGASPPPPRRERPPVAEDEDVFAPDGFFGESEGLGLDGVPLEEWRDASDDNVVFEVYGRSMGGFELGAAVEADDGSSSSSSGGGKSRPWWRRRRRYYDLAEQVAFVEQRLMECVDQLARGTQGRAPKVVLVGHSVGSYVLLELVQRHRERLEKRKKSRGKGVRFQEQSGEEGNSASSGEGENAAPEGRAEKRNSVKMRIEPDIIGGICLFPTVVNIGRSSSGKVLTALSKIPFFPTIVSTLSRTLTTLLPSRAFTALVASATGMSGHALATTCAFLHSSSGVHQALHMGIDEMRRIGADAWGHEVWGAVDPAAAAAAAAPGAPPRPRPRPRLFFFFGEHDAWVARDTRDDLMRVRGRGERADAWRPWMEIDRNEIPHAFCLAHSAPVADKCREYIAALVALQAQETRERGGGADAGGGAADEAPFSLMGSRLSRMASSSQKSSLDVPRNGTLEHGDDGKSSTDSGSSSDGTMGRETVHVEALVQRPRSVQRKLS